MGGCLLILLAVLAWSIWRKRRELEELRETAATSDRAWVFWTWQAHPPVVRAGGAVLACLIIVAAISDASDGGPLSYDPSTGGYVSANTDGGPNLADLIAIVGWTAVGVEALMWIATAFVVVGRDTSAGTRGAVSLWQDSSDARGAWIEHATTRLGEAGGQMRALLIAFAESWWAYVQRWGTPPPVTGPEGHTDSGPAAGDDSSSRAADASDDSISGVFAMLGLRPTASWEEIQRAHREMAKRLHPDAHPTASAEEKAQMEDKLKLVNDAYNILKLAHRR